MRTAKVTDLQGIKRLLEPLEDAGILMKRSQEEVLGALDSFIVVERGHVIACAALFLFFEEKCGEVAAIAVSPECRGQGQVDKLLDYIEKKASSFGLLMLFLLTTRTEDWYVFLIQDKWRNLNCMTNGLGSRHRTTHRNNQLIPKRDEEEGTSQSLVIEKDDGALYETPVTQCKEKFEASGSIKQMSRLDDLILEAVTKLKEPRGSSRHSIAEYIEEHHWTPPDFESTLAAYLKLLTEIRRLAKVRHYYRIAPRPSGNDPTLMHSNGAKKNLSDTGKDGLVILTKAQIDAELEKMKSMTSKEAVAAAAQAVAAAEAAIAVAEAAVMEAEEAEAEAEAAYRVADAAQKALNCDIIGV